MLHQPYLTWTWPIMPASAWPGSGHQKKYVPGWLGTVKVTEPDPPPGISFLAVTPICGAMMLWTVAPAFFRSTVIVEPALAFVKVLGWYFMVSIIWTEA